MSSKRFSWKVLARKKIFDNIWQRIYQWKVRTPSGAVQQYSFSGWKDFIFVFIVTSDNRVVVLKQYHLNLETYHTTLVAGFIDGKEKPVSAVKREIAEETGYTVKKIIPLGWGVRGKWSLGIGHYFLATGAVQTQTQDLEDAEDITVQLVSFSGLKKLLAQHAIVDAHAEACAWRALTYLKKV